MSRSANPWLAGGMLALLCVMGGTAIAAGAGSQQSLQQLMSLLAQRRHGEVTYTEKDYLSVLEGPLTSSGVLIYDAPDHLEKRTLKPKRESLVLQGSELTVQRGRHTYHLDLKSYPQVAPYVEAVRATLAGDLGGLESVFKVTFEGSLAHWKLGLVPLDRKAARQVRSIRIVGAEGNIRSVQIDKANGDRSVMRLGSPEGSPGR
ncbi:MAG: LolA-related protein [Steroidobacteraceae bacterium]